MKTIFTFAVCLTLATSLQSQVIIRVTPTGTGDGMSWATACSLENAISVVSVPLNDRTEIWIQKGTYYPSKMLIIPDSVKIYGGFAGVETALSQRNFSANPTIVDGQQKIGSIFRLENSVEINGFTIQNGNANGNPHKNGGGIWANENCVIENCRIINNTATLNGGGVYANGEVKIINTTIEKNVAIGSGNNMFGHCTVIACDLATSFSPNRIANCNESVPNFGEISFKSSTIWAISGNGINQEWSDAVMANGCNKIFYYGGVAGNYYSDCRANSDRTKYGDLFSWCTVTRFAHVLCPAPWRVPTKNDFINLDKALGGSGKNRTGDATVFPKYTAVSGIAGQFWGGSFGSYCTGAGTLGGAGGTAYYWAQTSYNATTGCHLNLRTGGGVYPQNYNTANLNDHALQLRCVR